MAITITSPSNANLTDSTTSKTITVSGKTSGSTIAANISVHGSTLASGSTTGTSLTLTYSKNTLYDLLNGKSLSNAVTLTVYEIKDDAPLGYATLKDGDVTITARLSNQSWSTMANPYDLDNPTKIISSWTRPHAAFRARVKVYVNGVLVINRYNFTTSIGYTPTTTQINSMISAMKGVSPGALKVEVITQFNSTSVVDLESTGMSLTRSSGVVKAFPERSVLSSFSNFTIGDNISYTITQATAGTTHDITLKVGTATIFTKTNVGVGAKTVTPTASEITAMYNATSNVTSATATLSLITKLDGKQIGSTHSRTATATVGANIVPDFTAITHSETTTTPDVAAIVGKYVQGISNLTLAITGATPGTGATIKSYQITLGNTVINSSSGTTGVLTYSGNGLVLKGKVTDSRGRVKEKTVTVDILPYAPPVVSSFEFLRCDAEGVASPIGTYVKFRIKASASSLWVDGVEKNSLTLKCYTKPIVGAAWTLKDTIEHTSVFYEGSTDPLPGYVITESFDGRVFVTDKFNTTIAFSNISSGVLMSWGKTSVAIGKVVEDETRLLDVAGDIYENGVSLSSKYGIQDSGSNENGSYIIYSDGTMECWHEINLTRATTNSLNAGWTFPIPFLSGTEPDVQLTLIDPLLRGSIDTGGIQALHSLTIRNISNVSVWSRAQVSSGYTWTEGDNLYVKCRAIGRYK